MTYSEMIAELKGMIEGWIEMKYPPRGYIGVSYTKRHGFIGVVANHRRADYILDKTFTIDGRKKGETTEVKIGLVRLSYRDVKYEYFANGIPGLKSYSSYQDLYKESKPDGVTQTNGIEWYSNRGDGTAVVYVPELVEDEGALILVDGYARRRKVRVVEHVVKVLDAADCGIGGKDRSKVISWAATLQPGATFLDSAGYLVINDTGATVVVQNQTYVEDWGDSRYGGHFE
jgi:hypothetical protein